MGLAEEAADRVAIDAYREAKANGTLRTVPLELVERMLDGEHPVRAYREHRGFTQQALADASGVNRVYLAEIESGRKRGSVEALKRLAEALGVTIDDLVP